MSVVFSHCFFRQKTSSRATFAEGKKKIKQFQSSCTTAISRETSGEDLKEECVTQLQTASQKEIFFHILQQSEFAGAHWRLQEYNFALRCTQNGILNDCV